MSKFLFWCLVSDEQHMEEEVNRALITSQGVWNADGLWKRYNSFDIEKPIQTKEDIVEALKNKIAKKGLKKATLEETLQKVKA